MLKMCNILPALGTKEHPGVVLAFALQIRLCTPLCLRRSCEVRKCYEGRIAGSVPCEDRKSPGLRRRGVASKLAAKERSSQGRSSRREGPEVIAFILHFPRPFLLTRNYIFQHGVDVVASIQEQRAGKQLKCPRRVRRNEGH